MPIPPDHVLAWRDISCVGHPSHRCLLEAASMILCRRPPEKRENAVVKAESEVAGDEGTGKSENA